MNGGIADIYGGEAGLEFLVVSRFSGFANYAYQEVGQISDGFNRREFPHHKVNVGLRAKLHPLSGKLLYHHSVICSVRG